MSNDFMDKRWWRSKGEVHAEVYGAATEIAQSDGRRKRLRWYKEMYEDEGAESFDPDLGNETRNNVTQNGIDAVHARLLQAQPRPTFDTFAGDWSLQRRAKKLSLWMDGEFERLQVYDEIGDLALQDALTEGDAVVKGFIDDDDRPGLELVWAGDIHIPRREQRHLRHRPRTMYQTHHLDREVLAERHPEHRDTILGADGGFDDEQLDDITETEALSDFVMVVEAWRLGGKDGKGGKYALCVSNATLVYEDWEHDRFPFAVLRCWKKSRSFWSQGFAQRLYGPQAELNDMSGAVAGSYGAFIPSLWVQTGSDACLNQMDDSPGRLYDYSGDRMPAILAPRGALQEFSAREETLLRRCYEERGISQLSASSVKPAGLNSGKALNVHQDIESVRFQRLGRNYERFFIDIAKLLLFLAEQITESDASNAKKLRAMGGKEGLMSVSYDEVRMSDDQYRVRVMPVSKLSSSTAARIQEVTEMMQSQLIDADTGLQLLDMPDLDQYNSLRSAGRQSVERAVEMALDGKKAEANGFMPLDYAIKWGTLHALKAQNDGAPSNAIDRVRDFVSHAHSIKKIQEQEAAQAAAAQQQPAVPQMPAMPPAA